MDRFEIKEINIKKYNSFDYKGIETKVKNKLFIYGEHKSGKSTTVDAILYAIFGTKLIFKPLNAVAQTKIVLENSSTRLTITRGVSISNELEILNRESGEKTIYTKANEIDEKIQELLKIDSYFTQMRTRFLLQNSAERLKNINSRTLINLIQHYSNNKDDLKKEDELKEKLLETLNEEQSINSELEKSKNKYKKLELENKQLEKNVEDLSELIKICESKKIEQYINIKNNNNKIWQKIDDLNSQRIMLSNEEFFFEKNKLSQEEFFDKKFIDIVKKIVEEINCPVCGGHVNHEKLKQKIRNNLCPMCNESVENMGLYENIKQKVKKNKLELPKTSKQLKEIQKNIKSIDDKLSKLSEKLEDNPVLINPQLIKFINHSFESSVSESQIKTLKDKFEMQNTEYKKIKKQIEELKNNSEKLEQDLLELNTNKQEYEKNLEEFNRKGKIISIKMFLILLNKYYEQLMSYKARPIIFENNSFYMQSKIKLKGIEKKDIFRTNEIGESEKKCIDMAMIMSFNELDQKNNITNMNFLILDEPFEGLYDDINILEIAHLKKNFFNLISSLKEEQVIILSAEPRVNAKLKYKESRIRFQKELLDYY